MSESTEKSTSAEIFEEVTNVFGDVDLSNAPRLRPANALRPKVKARVLAVAARLEDTSGIGTTGDISDSAAILDLIGDMDEALELLAIDPAAWVRFAEDPASIEKIPALFARVVEQVGESSSSAS